MNEDKLTTPSHAFSTVIITTVVVKEIPREETRECISKERGEQKEEERVAMMMSKCRS